MHSCVGRWRRVGGSSGEQRRLGRVAKIPVDGESGLKRSGLRPRGFTTTRSASRVVVDLERRSSRSPKDFGISEYCPRNWLHSADVVTVRCTTLRTNSRPFTRASTLRAWKDLPAVVTTSTANVGRATCPLIPRRVTPWGRPSREEPRASSPDWSDAPCSDLGPKRCVVLRCA